LKRFRGLSRTKFSIFDLWGNFAYFEESYREANPSTSKSHQGEWRMLFRSPEDDGHEITVHLFLFNLYADPARGNG